MSRMYLFAVLLLFLLAPYFNAGVAVNGGLLALVMIAAVVPSSLRDILRQRWFYGYATLFVALGAYSAVMASLYGGRDYSFLKTMIVLVIYMWFGFAVGRYLWARGLSEQEMMLLMMKLVLAIVVLNSVIIVLSFLLPPVKVVIESVLAEASNIDYKTSEFKLRGLASAGGAGLSVMHAVAAWIALALYRERRIGIVTLAVSCCAIGAAMLFIGRTGFILVGMALLFYICTATSLANFGRLLVVGSITGGCIALIWNLISDMLPAQVQSYSILFLFGGTEALRDEGTIETLSRELFIPDSMLHLLFGIGYFNGENILRQTTDPGYMKTLLSLGLPLMLLLYATLIRFLVPALRSPHSRIYIVPIALMLLVVEFKEPFFYTGYAARLLFVVGGASIAYQVWSRRMRTVELPSQPALRPTAG